MGWNLEDMPDLSGKIMIVTGANSGLGFETTRELARKGAKVIMACRNPERANTAKQKIKDILPNADLDVMILDVASQKSVADFADKFKEKYTRLDVLINNAGIMAAPYSKTVDGFESHLATNHLGHFALTGRLFNLLESTPGARIVSVSSIAHFLGKMDFENLMFEDGKGYGRWSAYGRSKMANLLFIYEMQKRLTQTGKSTLALAAHPGLARTNIMPAQSKNAFSRTFATILSYTLKPTIKGAMPVIRAAVETNVKGGEYFGPAKQGLPDVVQSTKASYDMDAAKQLWEVSEKLTGVHYLE